MTFLYVICEQVETETPVKIGFSVEPEKRVKQLQTGHSKPLVLFYKEAVLPDKVRALERIIHKTLARYKTSGEWFSLLPDEAVAEIRHAIIRYGDVDNLALQLKNGSIRL